MNSTQAPTINPPHTIGRASVESQDLCKYLRTLKPGQVATYKQMNEACKQSVQSKPGILLTARRTLLRDDGRVFGTLRGVGVKLLSNDEIPDEAEACVVRGRRAARKGLAIINATDITALSGDAKIRTITTKTILGLFSSLGATKTRNLIEQEARASASDVLKIGDVGKLFSK